MRIHGTLMGLLFLCIASLAWGAPNSLTYQGRIIKSDGHPLEYNNVSFLFEITSPDGLCVIYREQVNGINMENSGGVFDIAIGEGTQSYPGNGTFTLLDSFNNSSHLTCDGGVPYSPAFDEGRKLRVKFHDGSGWRTISPDTIVRSVPYAAYAASAAKLGDHAVADFVLKTGLPVCSAGTFLSWDGSALTCAAVAGASGGTVTDVTSANAYLTVTNSTSTPLLTVNVGTSANTVAAGNDPRLTNARNPTGNAGGDLSGTYPDPTVAKIQGQDISANIPTSGQFLKFTAAQWTPANIATGDVTGLNALLATYLTQSYFNSTIASANCAQHQTMYWSSATSTFLCQNINVSLAGDASGTIGAVSVDKIKGVAVDFTVAPASGQFLKYNGTSWVAASDNNAGGTITALTGDVSASGSGSVTSTVNSVGTSTAANIHSAELLANAATSANTGSTIIKRDVSGNFSASDATLAKTLFKDSGSNTVTLSAPVTVTSSYVLKLPPAQGANNQVLTSDGSGNLSWTTPAGTGVTSLAVTAPVTNSGTATAPNIGIPAATTSVNGYLTSTDWNTFNNKLGTATAFSGDISGAYNTTSVDKIKGKAVSATAPTSGQFLVYNGTTQYVPVSVSGDATMSSTGALTIASGVISNTELANMPANTLKGNATGGAAAPTDLTIASLQGTTATTFAAGNDSRITGALQTSGGTLTGMLTLATGTTTLSPLRIPSGVLVTTPVSGNIESDGASLYWTNSTPTRQKLAAYTGTPANGQLLIGNGTGFNLANITQGAGVTITNSAGGITIAATGSGGTVTSVTSANADIAVATGTSTPVLTLNSGTAGGAGDANKIAKLDAGGLIPTAMLPNHDASKITTGTLPIARGGTNSATALVNNRIMASTGGAVVEAAAITANKALISDANGIPTHSTVTNTELGYLSGVTSAVQTQINSKASSTGWTNYSAMGVNGAGALTAIPGAVSGSILNWTVTGPTWTTAAFPTSTTANQLLYSSANNVVGGLTSANNAVLTTNGTGVPSWGAISSDTFTQYALLAGRAGGQTLNGGSAASNNLTLDSTAHATKGFVLLNPTGGNVGIGTTTPASKLDVAGSVRVGTDATACAAGISGAIRYNGTSVEYCNGTSWTALAASGAGVETLNGLNSATQTFAVPGTTGTAPTWTSAGSAHTLNIPLASAAGVTAGLISKTDYDTFNTKLGTATAFSGDISGAYNTTSVDKIKGKAVSATAPTSGQFLVYNGTTQYVPVSVSGDATMSSTGALTIASGVVSNTELANMPANTLKGNITGGAAAPTDVTIASLQGTTATTFAAGNDSRITGALQTTGGTLTGMLTLATGSTTLSPLRIPAGTLVTTPVSGNIESDGTSLYYTNSTPTRQKLAAYTGTPANGQLLIGNGTGFSLANVTQGAGVTITNSAGGITIAATGSGGTVTAVSSANADIGVATGTTTPVLTLNSGTTGGAGDANKIAKLDAGGLLAAAMLPNQDASKITTGTLPIARGGTNSATALSNNRIMASTGGAIVEAAAITASRALVSDANGIPTHSAVTGTELSYLSGVTSAVQTQINAKASSTGWTNYSAMGVNGSGTLTAIPGATSGSHLNWTVTGPAWTTASFPSSTTANQLLYSSANNVVGGLATANNSVLTTNGSGVPSWSTLASDSFAQYALLAGRAGGQTLNGGTAASNNLTLDSTAHGTKGYVLINPSGGSVGIGTTTPNSGLQVTAAPGGWTTGGWPKNIQVGADGGAGLLRFPFNNSNQPAIGSTTDGILRFMHSGATDNTGTLSTDMVILPSGHVGIDTTTASNLLTVGNDIGATATPESAITLGSTSQNSVFTVGQSNANRLAIVWNYNATASSASSIITTTSQSNPLGLQTNGGNLGVGTSAPARTMMVVDQSGGSSRGISSRTYAANTGGIFEVAGSNGSLASPSALTTGKVLGFYTFAGYDGSDISMQSNPNGMAAFAMENWTPTARGTAINFSTTPIGTANGIERMRIEQNGYVGIGTVAGYPFHLGVPSASNGVNTNIAGFSFGADATLGPLNMFLWGNTSATASARYMSIAVGDFTGARNLVLNTHSNGATGNVGIGTTNPTYSLHVVGTAGLSSGTAWTAASDIRLKDIQGDYEYGLDEILKLHTVRFNYKKGNPLNLPSDTPMTGFIAQEVRKVIPDAVHTRKDGYLELNVDPIHWATVNAVQELYEMCKPVANLELENKKLKERVGKLEADNELMKASLCQKDPTYAFCK